jgi:hypothetical protein
VARQQGRGIDELRDRTDATRAEVKTTVDALESRLRRMGVALPDRAKRSLASARNVGLRPWDEIATEAEGINLDAEALLPAVERSAVIARVREIGDAVIAEGKIDWVDGTIAGLAATLAGLADVLLIQIPRHPGFLGSPAHSGGWLSNIVKEKLGELLPPASVHALEREFPVPFDPSTNRGLETGIAGLGPRTHRFHSLGHDPILGWLFGVTDILRGTFTGVDEFGKLISQPVAGQNVVNPALSVFEAVLEAFRRVGGHLLSDVATPAGLPAPLMPLALFFQTGSIGPRGYSVAAVARQMYRSGYDFRHFIAGSVSTLLIEVVVRGAWVIRRLNEGVALTNAMPSARHPRLRKTLLIAHSGAAAINAGKIYFTGPLGLNWSQWLMLSRYAARETVALLADEGGKRRDAAINSALEADLFQLSAQIHSTWAGPTAAVPGITI